MAVAILSLPTGIDFSEYSPQYKNIGVSNTGHVNFAMERSHDDLTPMGMKPIKLMHVDSNLNLEGLDSNSNSYVIPQQRL